MENTNKIEQLKAEIKQAKQDNKPYKVVADLESQLTAERNKDTLKGAFLNMRKVTADIFYRNPDKSDKEIKKMLIVALRESAKEIEAVEVE